MKFYGNSDVGIIRKVNEDSYFVNNIEDNCIVALVADGMGGHRGGKKASEIASTCIFDAIEKKRNEFINYDIDKFRGLLVDAACDANNIIYDFSAENEKYSGMGTTVVVCLIYGDKYYVISAGDSRMYIYKDKLVQITRDHSYVRELVDLGLISEQEALIHPNKNVITRALGTERNIEFDFYTGKLSDSSVILLCSDGLTNMVSQSFIENVLDNGDSPEQMVELLIDKANENGGKDNVSIVVIVNDEEGGVKS